MYGVCNDCGNSFGSLYLDQGLVGVLWGDVRVLETGRAMWSGG
jgi:hypothetical protein